MPVSVAMMEKSYEIIAEQLNALALDINVYTFNETGKIWIDGVAVSPNEVEIDYIWLSSHINASPDKKAIFDLILACKSVTVLQTYNAGLDNPFYKKLSDKGTRICNSSAQAIAISEYVMAQVLSVVHPIDEQRVLQTNRQWKNTPFRELSQTNWLIFGYGPIGQEVAKRVRAFEASLSVIRRTPTKSEFADKTGTMEDLETFLPKADVIVLACPLNNDTRGFADEPFFANVKEGAILINIARGGLIDDSALISALDAGRLDMAILDVFHREPLPDDSPLWSHQKVRLTSHTSFAGEGVHKRWNQMFLDNITLFISGEKLLFEVDPDIIV